MYPVLAGCYTSIGCPGQLKRQARYAKMCEVFHHIASTFIGALWGQFVRIQRGINRAPRTELQCSLKSVQKLGGHLGWRPIPHYAPPPAKANVIARFQCFRAFRAGGRGSMQRFLIGGTGFAQFVLSK